MSYRLFLARVYFFIKFSPSIIYTMNRVLSVVLTLLLFPALQSHANEPDTESLRAGAMYLIAHKSEIVINRGYFGLFSPIADNQVDISFHEELDGERKYEDSLIYDAEESRRIGHDLFAYDRKVFELDSIKKKYPEFFSKEEPRCQNAFFPYTVCLIENQ